VGVACGQRVQRGYSVASEVVDVRWSRVLGGEARRIADAALVVGEHDEAERRVEVDEQVVAVAAAGLRAMEDHEGGVAARRHGSRYLPDDPNALASESDLLPCDTDPRRESR